MAKQIPGKQLTGVFRTDVTTPQYISGSLLGNGWSISSDGVFTGVFSGSSGDYVDNVTFIAFSSSVDSRILNITGSAGSGSIGPPGPSGSNGQDGRGIISASLDPTGSLSFTFDKTPFTQSVGRITGDRYATTSTTSITVPNNNDQVTLTVEISLAYTPKQSVIVSNDGIAYFTAEIDSYNASTGALVVTCTKKHGSGTFNTWTINLAGSVGVDGEDGRGIVSITQPSGSFDALITYTTGGTDTLLLPSGSTGAAGRGITSVTQPSGTGSAQINYTTGSADTITLPIGPSGSAGRGITTVTQPSGSATAFINYTSGSSDVITLPTGSVAPETNVSRASRPVFFTHFDTGTFRSTGTGNFANANGGWGILNTDSTTILMPVGINDVPQARGPGYMQLAISTSGSNVQVIRGAQASGFYTQIYRLSHGNYSQSCALYFPTITDSSQSYVLRFGVRSSTVAATLNNSAYIEMGLQSGTPRWSLVTTNSSGTATTSTNLVMSISSNIHYKLEIFITDGVVRGLIDGVDIIEGGNIGANLPTYTTGYHPFYQLIKTNGTGTRQVFVDWHEEIQILSTPYV